ncbi:MAG TPA: FkbM family methyltransferase, partial [Actinomycetota bacterium]|nr:FkbM family methyltransferase [Actinomycetota bacterium]
AAAAYGRKVLAVEASGHNAALLRASASKNGFLDLVAVHAAVGNRFGTVRFRSEGPYGRIEAGSSGPADEVPLVRVDALLGRLGWRDVTFVKVDVEGAEIECLQGMESLLAGPEAPPVLFESNVYRLREAGYEPADLLRQVETFGYQSFLVADAERRLIRTRPDELQATTVVNYLAFKGDPPQVDGWTYEEAMPADERLLRITTEAGWRDPLHRAAIAGSLAAAPPDVLADPQIAGVLDGLRNDPEESVRDAASAANRASRRPEVEGSRDEVEEAAAAEAVLREAAAGMNEALWADVQYLSQVLASAPAPAPPPAPAAPAGPADQGFGMATELLQRAERLLTVSPGPDTWRACPVTLPHGPRFEIMVDTQAGDPISQAYLGGAGPVVDEEMVDLAMKLLKPGDVFVDLGTFLGTFSLPAAAIGCHVLSVDASHPNILLLRASVARNGFWNMNVVYAAVSDEAGHVEFCPNGPVGHVATEQIDLPKVQVRAVRVDDLLDHMGWPKVNLLKVDVEGFEIKALRGMARRLTDPGAPTILFESNGHTLDFFGSSPSELLRELERYGYTNYLVLPGRLVRTRPEELQPSTVVNYLAVKGGPPMLKGWRVEDRLTTEERVSLLVREVGYKSQDHSAYVAKALSRAEAEILNADGIDEVIAALRNDPSEVVRRAAERVPL